MVTVCMPKNISQRLGSITSLVQAVAISTAESAFIPAEPFCINRMGSFWTPSSCREFHCAVARLRQRTEIPAKPHSYRNDIVAASEQGVLSFYDELHIADGLAFLAHHDEGVDYVSTVTLREHTDGLSVILASNSTPSEAIKQGLRIVLGLVSQYARMRKIPDADSDLRN